MGKMTTGMWGVGEKGGGGGGGIPEKRLIQPTYHTIYY